MSEKQIRDVWLTGQCAFALPLDAEEQQNEHEKRAAGRARELARIPQIIEAQPQPQPQPQIIEAQPDPPPDAVDVSMGTDSFASESTNQRLSFLQDEIRVLQLRHQSMLVDLAAMAAARQRDSIDITCLQATLRDLQWRVQMMSLNAPDGADTVGSSAASTSGVIDSWLLADPVAASNPDLEH